jgi:hypothetical protein
MHAVLLLKSSAVGGLSTVAARVFDELGLTEFEERESSNYPPDDHYFCGYARNATVEVCDADESGNPEYPYWLTLTDKTSWKDAKTEIVAEPESIAQKLANAGFTVFIPGNGWGQLGWKPHGKVFESRAQSSGSANSAA